MSAMNRLFGRARDRVEQMLGKRDRYRRVFAGADGRAVLADLLRHCGVTHDAFVPGDPGHTAYNAGKQAAGNRILRILQLSDDELIRLIENSEAITEDMEDEHNG